MIAKVIASGETRKDAISRLASGLESMIVHGATTNLPFLQAVLSHPDFRSGRFSTEVKVAEGDVVEEGEVLAVVESMKMQLEVHAPLDGKVERVLVSGGDVLDGPELLAVFAPGG